MPAFAFLNSGFLWALPLAAIPVIIHFLSRRRLPEIAFPTVMFLRALEPREIRRLKLRELLLLLLRTLAILFLVCAFARPSVEPPGATTRAAAAVAVVIDDSESMGALDEQARPRAEAASERALAIVDAARPGDEIAITTTTGEDAPLANRSGDRVRLTRTVRRIAAGWLPADLKSAFMRARRFLMKSGLRSREIYVISDFQKSNVTADARAELSLAARSGIRIYPIPVVVGRVPNHGFADLDPELRPGPQGKGLEMRTRLANYAGAPSERLAVRVRRGDALIGGGDVTLQADESRWAAVPIEWRDATGAPSAAGAASAASAGAASAASPAGAASAASAASAATPASASADPTASAARQPVVVESDQDALPADDRWYAVLGAPRKLRVLRVAEARAGSPSPRFASLALDPLGDRSSGFVVEEGTPASLLTLSKSRSDVVLLEDIASLSGDAEAKLRAFLRSGGGVVLALGQHADPEYYGQRLFPGMIDLTLEGIERAPEGQTFELKARVPSHPILEGLSVGVGASLTQARIRGLHRARVLTPKAEVVVATNGGMPVVVATPQVSVFLTSLAEDWGDLPFSGAYVPLVRGLIEYAARAAAPEAIDRPVVGRPPAARLDASPSGVVTVRGPVSYRSQASVIAEGAGYRAVADQIATEPGFYTFESANREEAVVAINPDPIESDLSPCPVDSLWPGEGEPSRALLTLASLKTHLRETRQGRELWLPFLVVSALFFAAELVLGSARVLKP